MIHQIQPMLSEILIRFESPIHRPKQAKLKKNKKLYIFMEIMYYKNYFNNFLQKMGKFQNKLLINMKKLPLKHLRPLLRIQQTWRLLMKFFGLIKHLQPILKVLSSKHLSKNFIETSFFSNVFWGDCIFG